MGKKQGDYMRKLEVERLSKLLVVKFRADNTIFVCNKDTNTEADRELIIDFHGTDFLPDDFRYETIMNILDRLLEYDISDLDSIRGEIVNSLIDISNYDLIQWLASNSSRADYCAAARADFCHDASTFMGIITMGQYLEIDEIFGNIQNHLEAIDLNNNTEAV